MSAPPGPADIHVRILRTMARWLAHETSPADVARFLAELGLDDAALRDDGRWVDYALYARAWETLRAITGNPAVGFQVGRFTISRQNLGALWPIVRAAGFLGGGTAAGYRMVPRVTGQLSRVGRFAVETLGPSHARIRWTQEARFPFAALHCDYRRGILSAGPRVADLPPADVADVACLGRGDPACVYDVRFAADRAVNGRRWGLAAAGIVGVGAGVAGFGWLAAAAAALAVAAMGVAFDRSNQLAFNTATLSDQLDQLLEAKLRLEQDNELLRTTQEQLREKERLASLGELSARVAHELRNPLGVIKASAQVLADETKPPDVRREVTGFILEEADRMSTGLTNLLVFARPKLSHRTPVEVPKVVERLLLEWEVRGTAGLAVRFTAAEGLPRVLADPHQLHQVLLNLLLNASDALGGRGTITIGAARDAGAVLLTVDDDGPGFGVEARARAFEPFFTTKQLGTGLGLTNVLQMVQANGGTVTLGASPAGGARVALRLEAL
jgi:signal transduction histidine kinase